MKTPFEKFFDQYLTTALWSSTTELEPNGGEPMDSAGYGIEDIDPATLAKMRAECEEWFNVNADLIASTGFDPKTAGHDFWLTRNRHGAGFWDGDWPEPAATVLTDAAHAAGERDLYVGDDGRVYCYQL